jgi:hypothetical protein
LFIKYPQGTERSSGSLNIFLEYVPGGSIASLLAKFGSFRETVVRVYTRQILSGLAYLHGHGIAHRDIKGANILVDNTGLVKLADFGASRRIEDLVTMESGFKSVKGTPYWMAPEVIKQSGHGRQADIWSVACTVIEMATGKPPWSQFGSQVSAMFAIASSKGPPTIPEHVSPDCKDFLYLCFNRNWRERPQAATLLQHPFVANAAVRTVAAPLNIAYAPTPVAEAMTPAADVVAGSGARRSLAMVGGGGGRLATIASEGSAGDAEEGPEWEQPSSESDGEGRHVRRELHMSVAAAWPTPRRQAAAASRRASGPPGIGTGTDGGGGVGCSSGGAPPTTGPMSPLRDHLATSAAGRQALWGLGQAGSAGPSGGSPSKRISMRASAPVFGGYGAAAFSSVEDLPPMQTPSRQSKERQPPVSAPRPPVTSLYDGSREGLWKSLQRSGSGVLDLPATLRISSGSDLAAGLRAAGDAIDSFEVPTTIALPPLPQPDSGLAAYDLATDGCHSRSLRSSGSNSRGGGNGGSAGAGQGSGSAARYTLGSSSVPSHSTIRVSFSILSSFLSWLTVQRMNDRPLVCIVTKHMGREQRTARYNNTWLLPATF